MSDTISHLGRYARSVESGWLGKVLAVEECNGDAMLKMMGVNEMVRTIRGVPGCRRPPMVRTRRRALLETDMKPKTQVTSPIRTIAGLVINPGAQARVIWKAGGIATISVKLGERAVDSLRVRVPVSELRHLARS